MASGVLVVVYQRPRVKKPSSRRTSTTIKMIQSKLTVAAPPFWHTRSSPFGPSPKPARLDRYAPRSDQGGLVIRVFVVYEAEPDAGRYEQHAELCRRVPGATFRHGRVFGAPMGEPRYPYYAEWEFPDLEAFKSAARTDEFMATGKDAMEMGIPFHVHFAEVE
jgi:hypothetical protein